MDSWLTATVETSWQLLGLPIAPTALLGLQEADKLVGEVDAGDISPSDMEGLVLLEEPGEGKLDLGRQEQAELSRAMLGSKRAAETLWHRKCPPSAIVRGFELRGTGTAPQPEWEL